MLLPCGHRAPAGVKFCPECGASAERPVHQEVGAQDREVRVQLVEPQNPARVERELQVQLRGGGRLPVRELCAQLGVRGLVWVDLEERLEAGPDGLSTVLFGAFPTLRLSRLV